MQALQLLLNSLNSSVWLTLAGFIYLSITLSTAIHVLLNQEREGSAIAWLGIIFLSPGIGIVVYWLLGINRIKRRARREFLSTAKIDVPIKSHAPHSGPFSSAAQNLMTTGRAIHADTYVDGNQLQALDSGDQTYPAMLAAIVSATESVYLSSYIFDYDRIGRRFIDALGFAHSRGVLVRVIIDGVGIGYSFSWIKTDRALRERGIETARFLPTLSRRGTRFINLRNHRKILSIDGKIAFIGGINIRDNNILSNSDSMAHKNRDLHFRLTGPVIRQINTVFIEDWQFATGENLTVPETSEDSSGGTICRILPDGPDENYLKLQTTITAAINAASDKICIVTPYFLPGSIVLHALKIAVLRGVKVQVVVPKKSNIRVIDWAFRAELKKLLDSGIDIYFSPEPFDHSKLFLVDDYWCFIGSSNWDSRSLRLNFEVNLECFDQTLNATLTDIFVEKRTQSNFAVGLHSIDQSLPARLRNSFCRLFSPYL